MQKRDRKVSQTPVVQLTSAAASVADGLRRAVGVAAADGLVGATAGDAVVGVALVAGLAGAHGAVVDGAALGVGAALRALAHVLALGHVVLFAAEGGVGAVAVHQADDGRLAAVGVGVAHGAGRAEALVAAGDVLALGSRAARAASAEVDRLASPEGVALEPIAAEADRLVALGETQGVLTTLVVHAAGNCSRASRKSLESLITPIKK